MVKKSGCDLVGNFVQTFLGSSSANSAPTGVSNLNAAPVNGGGTRKRGPVKSKPAPKKAKPVVKPAPKTATKLAPKKAKPAPKKAKPASKTSKSRLSNKHLVTKGGMNVTPLITALLALGLRIANENSLTSNKKIKGGANKKGGAPSLEHFVQSLQLGGNEVQNGSGTPFAFNSDGNTNTSIYDPSALKNASALTTQKYDDILSDTAVYKTSDADTNQYLSPASARSATTGGSRKKRSARSKSPVRKSSSAKKSKPATHRKRRGGAEGDEEVEESVQDPFNQGPTEESPLNPTGEQEKEPGGPQNGGRGRKRSPRKPVTKRSKSPVKKTKKARSKSPVRVQRRTRGRRGGNGNCSAEASDLII